MSEVLKKYIGLKTVVPIDFQQDNTLPIQNLVNAQPE